MTWRVVYVRRSGVRFRSVAMTFGKALNLLRIFEDAIALEHTATRFRIPRLFLSRRSHEPED